MAQTRSDPAPALQREKVWDPVTRGWHWLLATAVTAGWLLGEFRDFDTIEWHMYLGYTVGVLLVFRFLWGLVGPQPIRLRSLVPSPAAILAYVSVFGSRTPGGEAGHSPLGALSVCAILLALTVQVITGLCAESEDYFVSGPLTAYITTETAITLTSVHHLCSKVVLLLVVLHLAAILYYLLWKRENLVVAMITGWKWVRRD